jgi:hypothetical protein
VAELPRLKALVKRHAGRPFAIVGVNTDTDREAYQQRLESQGITWRSAWQGSTRGPLVTAWGIDRYPTVIVLDADHVIRHVDARGEALDRAVAELLAELGEPVPEPEPGEPGESGESGD